KPGTGHTFRKKDGCLFRILAEQRLIVRVDGSIALAGCVPQALQIDDLDASPRVLDKSRLLQRVSDERNAGSPDPEHFGKKLLGERKRIAGQVPGAEQPAAQPCRVLTIGAASVRYQTQVSRILAVEILMAVKNGGIDDCYLDV